MCARNITYLLYILYIYLDVPLILIYIFQRLSTKKRARSYVTERASYVRHYKSEIFCLMSQEICVSWFTKRKGA